MTDTESAGPPACSLIGWLSMNIHAWCEVVDYHSNTNGVTAFLTDQNIREGRQELIIWIVHRVSVATDLDIAA